MPSKKEYWQINTERLAGEIREAADRAHTEEDLKMAAEPILQHAFRDIGIDVDVVRYEKATGYRSKMDAVYGYLIIEYKAPGKLSRSAGLNEAKEKLEQYLSEEAERFGPPKEAALEKGVGVALDGQQILFARYSRSPRLLAPPVPIPTVKQEELFPQEAAPGFQFLGPYPVTDASLANLLIYARASARRPLTAHDLSKVFGPDSLVARQAVSELYSTVMRTQRRQAPSRIKIFFQEWDRIFGVVYGQELDKAEKAAAETAQLYQLPGGVRLEPLLFAIHTYYAFLMKTIAIELLAMQRESTVVSFISGLPALDDKALRDRLSYLESGADFINQGIVNFLEADFFSWYLDGWNPTLAKAFRGIVRALAEFEPATPVLEPEWTQDLLQKLYQLIVPKKLRHDLGEYYTPDWLAGYLVQKSGYDGSSEKRFLDPACGSGTFLVQAIDRATRYAESQKTVQIAQVAQSILKNIVGFDLNPLAVLAARTNYLIAFSRFIHYIRPISIPVYLCDSVVPPDRYGEDKIPLFSEDVVVFTTTQGDYIFPTSMKDKERIDKFTAEVDVAIRGKFSKNQFAKRLSKELTLSPKEIDTLVEVYGKIKELEERGENGIWARYIKNAFAPVYVGQFDSVVGNPPWIRWGYLADEYRKRTLPLWQGYGLFSLKGHESRLGAGEKDFSMLFTYASADRYLKDGGILAFVITLEAFKSKGAGEGFRRFRLGEEGAPLKVLWMENMVDLKPFEAANKTSIFALQKGRPTIYPIPVTVWKRKRGAGKVPPEWSLSKVLSETERTEMKAIPIDSARPVSSWQTAEVGKLKATEKMKGPNPYQAYRGASTEPYGVFWLDVREVRPDGLLIVANKHERGKREIPSVQTAIEKDLVFPAVSGGEIIPFGIESHFYVLISQDPETRKGYDEGWMSSTLPLTYAYLMQFKDILIKRALYQKYFYKEVKKKGKVISKEAIAPFYSMYNISADTFARYRIAWKRMASKMEAVVLSRIRMPFGIKTVISTDTTSSFAVDSKEEAHYLCAILNSAIINDFIRSFSEAGRGFGAPSVMHKLAIPRFDPKNSLHLQLSELSMEAHDLVDRGRKPEEPQKAINSLVGKLWNIKS